MKTIAAFLLLLLVCCVLTADAQGQARAKPSEMTLNRGAPTICTGGVVNKLALNLPKPDFSKAGGNLKAAGMVVVRVRIDEAGNVFEAKACAGHPLLRESAVRAARRAKFRVTTLGGKPVKVAGVIVYRLAPRG